MPHCLRGPVGACLSLAIISTLFNPIPLLGEPLQQQQQVLNWPAHLEATTHPSSTEQANPPKTLDESLEPNSSDRSIDSNIPPTIRALAPPRAPIGLEPDNLHNLTVLISSASQQPEAAPYAPLTLSKSKAESRPDQPSQATFNLFNHHPDAGPSTLQPVSTFSDKPDHNRRPQTSNPASSHLLYKRSSSVARRDVLEPSPYPGTDTVYATKTVFVSHSQPTTTVFVSNGQIITPTKSPDPYVINGNRSPDVVYVSPSGNPNIVVATIRAMSKANKFGWENSRWSSVWRSLLLSNSMVFVFAALGFSFVHWTL